MMRVHYYRDPHGNFGDDLNAWIWNSLVPDAIGIDTDLVMIGIGTLLNRDATDSYPEAKRWASMGSGAGYGAPPANIARDGWQHLTVRGPLSAHVLGAPPRSIGTDGAILLADLPEPPRPPRAGHPSAIVYMPHHQCPDLAFWREACRRAGIVYVDPTADSVAILRVLANAKLVLADAMHAAIVSDTLRVPWIPIVSSPKISMFKWLDWTLSMQLPYEPIILPLLSGRTRRAARAARWYGAVETFEDRTEAGATAHYAARLQASRTLGNRLKRKARRTLYKAAVARLAATARTGEREQVEATRILEDAARRPGFLSDHRVFADRLDLMRGRLAAVAALARG